MVPRDGLAEAREIKHLTSGATSIYPTVFHGVPPASVAPSGRRATARPSLPRHQLQVLAQQWSTGLWRVEFGWRKRQPVEASAGSFGCGLLLRFVWGRTGRMRRLLIVVAALSVGACGNRPTPSTSSAPVVVNPPGAAQLPDDGCPKVGEKAVPQTGQIAWTSSWDELPTVELIRNDEGEAWFLPTAWNKRTTGSYVGQNAFGARVAVTVQTVVTKGVAALDDNNIRRVYARSLLRGYGGYLSNSPTSFNLGPDRRIWLAGPKVGGRFDWETSREAKFNSPHESTYQYRADFTIKVECSAIVDKSGVVLQRP